MSEGETSDSSETSGLILDVAEKTQQYLPLYGEELITQMDLDKIPGDRPWRNCKTREEIAQYFNYGFDEITFRLYQKLLRA